MNPTKQQIELLEEELNLAHKYEKELNRMIEEDLIAVEAKRRLKMLLDRIK